MTNRLLRLVIFLVWATALAACAPVETKTTLVTSITGDIRTAGPGDTVIDFQSRRSLPNIVGKADLFGRTTNAGRTTVRYVGTRGGQAVFVRSDLIIESNATTMSETPLIVPTTSTTTMSGVVGRTPVSGSASSISYQVIPPRGSSEVATTVQPIEIRLVAGQSVTIQGRTLRVIRVSPASVEYRIE